MSKRASKTTKAFKSGNSIAVRLPARFGVKEGTEMRVREDQGRYVMEPVDADAALCPRLRDVVGSSRGMKRAPRLQVDLREADWERKQLDRG